jgi:TPP-dependent pyruvate/acetoin dehydrogenase alpha subunit
MNPSSIFKRPYYAQMVFIRTVESKLLEAHSKGLIKGTVHTCLGQEACAVGVMAALDRDRDVVFSTHRAHGHFLAYGGPVDSMIAEVMGLSSGLCAGIGGTQHLHWRNFYSNGIQGGMLPSALGAGLAEKMKGSGAVSVVFFGDGTMGEGTVYESLNIAALWNVPILFVLENNGYAQSTPLSRAHKGILHQRAAAFGLQTGYCDGNTVDTVARTAQEAINYVRGETKPFFLELTTYRLGPHSKGDDNRAEEELAPHRVRDPLVLERAKMTSAVWQAIDHEVQIEVDAHFSCVLKTTSVS